MKHYINRNDITNTDPTLSIYLSVNMSFPILIIERYASLTNTYASHKHPLFFQPPKALSIAMLYTPLELPQFASFGAYPRL